MSMKRTRHYMASIMILPLAGCVSLGQALANLPVEFAEDQVRRDLRYGIEPWQRLDVYYPEQQSQTLHPLVIFLHGGRWSSGNKSHYPFVAKALTDRGYVVAIPDYAKYPDVMFPSFVEDAAQAVSWLRTKAGPLQIDRSRIFVMGHSAGAHIGALLVTDPHYLHAIGGSRQWISGFAGLAGPYAFTPDEPDLMEIFGSPKHYDQMRVTTFIDGRQPPMLLLHGTDDDAVQMSNLEKMERTIRDKGGYVRTRIYHGVGHIGLIARFSWLYSKHNPVLDDIDRFFKEQGQMDRQRLQQVLRPAA